MKIVLDTNVVVSGILHPEGPCGRVLDLAHSRDVTIVYDDRILEEYEEVLTRPKFGLNPADVREFVELLSMVGLQSPGANLSDALPDEADRMFLECAVGGKVNCIVTGNKRHFPKHACPEIPVLSPAEFLDRL